MSKKIENLFFKKIEIWILYLILFLSLIFSILFGALVKLEITEGNSFFKENNLAWIPKTALFLSEIPGYLKGESLTKIVQNKFNTLKPSQDRFYSLDGFTGTPNNTESYLLLSRYDGELSEGVVELIDLKNFKIIHTWNPNIDSFNSLIKKTDNFKYIERDNNNARQILYHPTLTDDGGLLFNSVGLRKINSCSKLIFQNAKYNFHHSIEIDSKKSIWVPSHIYPQALPAQKVGNKHINDGGFLDDGIVNLSQDGDIIFEKSVSQIFVENGLSYLLFAIGNNFQKDPIHLNDIQPVEFDGEFWKKGDVFLSLRHQSMIVLYRPSTNKIVWKLTGPFFNQHDINILDNYRISIFNNNSKIFFDGYTVDGHNEVIIYDFKNNKYNSYLKNSLINNDVRTLVEGRSKILPNGELFVEETEHGRALYYNADGSLRWTYYNRAKNGNVYRLGWSRILNSLDDINLVKKFLNNKEECNE